MHRVEQDFDARQFALERVGKIKAVQLGNGIIQDRDVGPGFLGEFETGSSVCCLTNDLVIGLGFDELPYTAADGVVIVYNDDTSNWTRHIVHRPLVPRVPAKLSSN